MNPRILVIIGGITAGFEVLVIAAYLIQFSTGIILVSPEINWLWSVFFGLIAGLICLIGGVVSYRRKPNRTSLWAIILGFCTLVLPPLAIFGFLMILGYGLSNNPF